MSCTKFWINNVSDLFCDFSIIPLPNMNLEAKMNSLTRLSIIIFILLLLFMDVRKASIVFCTLLLIIIIYYFIAYNKMNNNKIENFKYNYSHASKPPQSQYYAGPKGYIANHRADIVKNPITKTESVLINEPTAFRFCNDEVPYEPNKESYISINQQLAGAPNPKTLIPPVIIPPIADLSYWKTNNLVTHSHVNDMKQIDNYQSGYQISTCCGDTSDIYLKPSKNAPPKLYRYMPKSEQQNYDENTGYKTFAKEDFKQNTTLPEIKENYNQLPLIQEIKPNESGQVNVSCGYNPRQLFEAGLPTNYPAGNCQQNPSLKQYNENLFKQTIQPGIYTTDQINEPINSNIGISFQQQFPPLTCRQQSNGDTLYTQHDPRLFTELVEPIEETVNESNVYDPRFSGYGTSYRAYTDDMIGQTRFYYDDVNAIRMPNYVTRSKIDAFPFADTYGPMQTEYGNDHNAIIKGLADDAWTRNSIGFRSEMQERLMRKNNANAWQQRVAPIYKTNQRMLSGGNGY